MLCSKRAETISFPDVSTRNFWSDLIAAGEWYRGVWPKPVNKLAVLSLTLNLPGLDGVAAVRQPHQLFKAPRSLVVQMLGQFKR